jgi:hypothetical protein
MAGFDQKSNVVLSDSKERVYSIDVGVEEIPLGLYLVKGDMMFVNFDSFTRSPHHDSRPDSSASSLAKSMIHWIRQSTLLQFVPNPYHQFDISFSQKAVGTTVLQILVHVCVRKSINRINRKIQKIPYSFPTHCLLRQTILSHRRTSRDMKERAQYLLQDGWEMEEVVTGLGVSDRSIQCWQTVGSTIMNRKAK